MNYFPQLSTGAVAQYPFRKRHYRRSVMNFAHGGQVWRMSDPDASTVRWELAYRGVTDAERIRMREFFDQVEGRLRTFAFLDPVSNLLLWSENLSKQTWQLDPMILVTEGENGELHLTNAGQVTQGFEQRVSVPGWFHYCFGVEMRADFPVGVRSSMRNANGLIEAAGKLDGIWRKIACSGAIPGTAEEVTCRLELEAGASVHLRRLQMQPQPVPSAYRKTTDVNGVYQLTRFDEDKLTFTAHGADDHSTVVRLVSRAGAQDA